MSLFLSSFSVRERSKTSYAKPFIEIYRSLKCSGHRIFSAISPISVIYFLSISWWTQSSDSGLYLSVSVFEIPAGFHHESCTCRGRLLFDLHCANRQLWLCQVIILPFCLSFSWAATQNNSTVDVASLSHKKLDQNKHWNI